jgi:Ner family transcriptional regulator
MAKKKKREANGDWHPADVKAELQKAGTSLSQLERENGYKPHTLKDVLRRTWPKAQELVAAAIGHAPEEIWPSRYPTKGRAAA